MLELVVYGTLVFICTLIGAWITLYPANQLIGWVAYLWPFAMVIIAVDRYFSRPEMQSVTWSQLLGMYAALLVIGKARKMLNEPLP